MEQRWRILIIDDEHWFRFSISCVLEGWAGVRAVADLESARNLLTSWQPHAVILDPVLRAGDSIDLLYRVAGKDSGLSSAPFPNGAISHRRIPAILLCTCRANGPRAFSVSSSSDEFGKRSQRQGTLHNLWQRRAMAEARMVRATPWPLWEMESSWGRQAHRERELESPWPSMRAETVSCGPASYPRRR